MPYGDVLPLSPQLIGIMKGNPIPEDEVAASAAVFEYIYSATLPFMSPDIVLPHSRYERTAALGVMDNIRRKRILEFYKRWSLVWSPVPETQAPRAARQIQFRESLEQIPGILVKTALSEHQLKDADMPAFTKEDPEEVTIELYWPDRPLRIFEQKTDCSLGTLAWAVAWEFQEMCREDREANPPASTEKIDPPSHKASALETIYARRFPEVFVDQEDSLELVNRIKLDNIAISSMWTWDGREYCVEFGVVTRKQKVLVPVGSTAPGDCIE